MSEQQVGNSVRERLRAELDTWQTRMDQAGLRLHLKAKDAQDRLQPHIDRFDGEMEKARQHLKQLEISSEGSWGEIWGGFKLCVKVMEQAFDRAQQEFTKNGERHDDRQ